MGRLNRAMKRKAEKLAFKEKMNIDSVHEEAVKNLVDERTRKTSDILISAIVLANMFDWSKMQNKEGRVQATLDSVHKYVNKILDKSLTMEEYDVYHDLQTLKQGGSKNAD